MPNRTAHTCRRVFPSMAQQPLNKCLLLQRSAFNHNLQFCISFMKWKLPTVCTYPGRHQGGACRRMASGQEQVTCLGHASWCQRADSLHLSPGTRLLPDDVKALMLMSHHFPNHDNETQRFKWMSCARVVSRWLGGEETRSWVPGRDSPGRQRQILFPLLAARQLRHLDF